jgi:hypothetical protein
MALKPGPMGLLLAGKDFRGLGAPFGRLGTELFEGSFSGRIKLILTPGFSSIVMVYHVR